MIDLRPLKEKAGKYPEPLKSLIELSRNTMSEAEFLSFFEGLETRAEEIDMKSKGDKNGK